MTDLTTTLANFLARYPILGGGAAVGFAGVLIASLRQVPGKIYATVRKRLYVTLEVTSDDRPFFTWMEAWAQTHVRFSRVFRPTNSDSDDPDRPESRFDLTPATGTHFLWTPFGWGWYHQTREMTQGSSVMSGAYSRTLTIEIFAPLVKPPLRKLLLQSYEAYKKTCTVERVRIYLPESDYWHNAGWLRKRPWESVILSSAFRDEIIDDLGAFLRNYEWYENLGVPHRRGYLFYGPPGNGKTSAAIALAHHFKLSVYSLALSTPGMSDDKLRTLMSSLPERCLLLLEDIDAAFDGRTSEGGTLSFSGLLNAIDGVVTSEGRVLIMTTNFPEKLDSALTRPGRVDRQWLFANADQKTAETMFDRFLPQGTESERREFVKHFGKGTYCMAALQERLVQLSHPTTAKEPLHTYAPPSHSPIPTAAPKVVRKRRPKRRQPRI